MSDDMTRRGFVKGAGYTGVAAAMLGGLAEDRKLDAAVPEPTTQKSRKEKLAAEKVRIGTLVRADVKGGPANYIRQILPYGFESFSICFDALHRLDQAGLAKMAADIREVLGDSGAVVSSVGIYGNPLIREVTADGWKQLIDAARFFGCNIVAGFAGRIVDKPVPDSMKRFAEVFGPLAKRAADQGERLAFENCEMGGTWQRGDWNIAHNPTAWEMMFNAVPLDNIGLQWEPSHQLGNLIEPLPQLHKYVKRMFHIHGKDATVKWDVIREHGIGGSHGFIFHRTPGFGDTNWTDIISELRWGGFKGSIDIEGWHDPVYKDELEMTGQVAALKYLKRCRGNSFVPNPT